MNTVQIECFLSVARHLNFARASEQLNLSQPAVTHQIQSLEAELGIKLFNRSTRTVELTPEGQMFVEDARGILHICNRAKAKFSDTDNAEMLPFNIGCSDISQIWMLDTVLSRTKEIYPNIHPCFRQLPRGTIFPKLEDGMIDVAFGLGEDTSRRRLIEYHELALTAPCCICPHGHPLTKLESVSKEDLESYKLIIHDLNVLSPATVSDVMSLTGRRHVADIYHNEHVEDAIVLVKAGFGISIQPRIFIPCSREFSVIPVKDMKELSFGMYTKRQNDSRILKAFMRITKEEFQGQRHPQNKGTRQL